MIIFYQNQCLNKPTNQYTNGEARLAQSVERQTLNLVVEGSSPSVGASFLFLDFYD